jgi:DNA-binding IclR family transcriptional regulator
MPGKNHRLLEQSFEIISFIASKAESVSFKEICDNIELPKSTVHNLVQTLVNLNILEKKDDSGKFIIGLKCFELGNAYLSSNPFYNQAKEIIEAISIKCNETTHFAILNGTDVVYLYKFDSTQPLRIFSHVGKRVPAHATAIGKALLSGYTDQEIRKMYPDPVLPSMTPNTITSVYVLLEQLREIRRTNVAYEKEESSPYVQCYAVPILNRQGFPVAGISISTPIYREENDTKKLVSILLEAKELLNNLLRLYE